MQNMTILGKKLCAKKEKQAPEICAELIRKATVGDRDALTDLYQLSYQELYRSIRAMVRDEDLALDIEQDTYLKAFSSLHQLRSPEAFFPWLRQIAVNRAKELLRKRQPILFTDLTPEDADQPMEIADQSPYASPEMQLEAKEVQRQVREILDDLPAGQRMIAAMYFYEGMNSREIAAQLGVNPATVRVQIHNGKKSIEKRVRALEAKGVKLFGLSPIPFLVALLHRLQPAVREKRKDLEDILAKAAPEGAAAVTAVTAGSAFCTPWGSSWWRWPWRPPCWSAASCSLTMRRTDAFPGSERSGSRWPRRSRMRRRPRSRWRPSPRTRNPTSRRRRRTTTGRLQ